MLKSVHPNQKRLPELVSEQIKELIAKGNLKAGDKLPNEFEMAEQLQVGRGTIREAVKILVSQNVLEIKRGNGTFVCERTGLADDPLGLWMIEDKQKLALDLCEVRMMIEPEIAELAAERGTKDEIASLKNAGYAVEEKIRSGEDHSAEDINFHEALAKMSKNQVVPKLIPVIQSAVNLFVKATDSVLREETIETHNKIIRAVEDGDGAGAKAAMEDHLKLNKEEIQRLISR
ncbi:FadR/GntR family transcriptional regulator [Murimonas intestini]|uniref:FadR/GntR family transcriptional regulator n=1 Tax=Murimonas intestini TaxID=1337051 RepID=UPI0011DDCD1D|nr:FadR/GntR family transcriptional regulator [Murimonas intestini]